MAAKTVSGMKCFFTARNRRRKKVEKKVKQTQRGHDDLPIARNAMQYQSTPPGLSPE